MPSHSIAKSAIKPIFSPLPPPQLFRPKISVFLAFLHSEPYFGRFFERSHSFFCPAKCSLSCPSPFRTRFRAIFRGTAPVFCPEKRSFFLPFSILHPVSDDFSRDRPTLFPPHSPFHRTRPSFRFELSSSLPLLHLPLRIYSLSGNHSPLIFTPPHFLSHSSPLFHLSPQLTNRRAHSRASRAYTYERTHPHVRRFSFIAFTPSPTSRNTLYINALGAKANKKNLHKTHNNLIINELTANRNFICREPHLSPR